MSITGKTLKKWGVPQGVVYGHLLGTIAANEIEAPDAKEAILALLAQPQDYTEHEVWGAAAASLIPAPSKEVALVDEGCPITIFGKDIIDSGALDQIEIASKLPVSVSAALMPDAHQGYGLPIGSFFSVRWGS